mmetsp:Transcript_22784/g.50158  ORF Transcript_22784/g.50158 Transcript_22784/m.50158 type:complete len:147 (+) Transcript_22784:928-1368(+)
MLREDLQLPALLPPHRAGRGPISERCNSSTTSSGRGNKSALPATDDSSSSDRRRLRRRAARRDERATAEADKKREPAASQLPLKFRLASLQDWCSAGACRQADASYGTGREGSHANRAHRERYNACVFKKGALVLLLWIPFEGAAA